MAGTGDGGLVEHRGGGQDLKGQEPPRWDWAYMEGQNCGLGGPAQGQLNCPQSTALATKVGVARLVQTSGRLREALKSQGWGKAQATLIKQGKENELNAGTFGLLSSALSPLLVR